MIELTEQQAEALKGETPPRVLNPLTRETFVLVRQDQYEVMRKIVDGPNRRGWDDPALDVYEQYWKVSG